MPQSSLVSKSCTGKHYMGIVVNFWSIFNCIPSQQDIVSRKNTWEHGGQEVKPQSQMVECPHSTD